MLTLIPFLALKQRDHAVEGQDAGALVAILEIKSRASATGQVSKGTFPLSFIVAFKHNSQVDLDLSPFCVTSLISDHIPGFQEKHTLKHFYDKRLEGDMVVCW